MGLLLPRSRTLLFSSLNFMRFFSTHFSSLSRSLWPIRRSSQLDAICKFAGGALCTLMMMLNRVRARTPFLGFLGFPRFLGYTTGFWSSRRLHTPDLYSLSPDTQLVANLLYCRHIQPSYLISISMKISKTLLKSR